MTELTERARAMRSAIAGFINARREAKLKGSEDDVAIATRYQYEIWLADAASRAKHLQSVTHILKATHPSARGTNVFAPPTKLAQRAEIGTHCLGSAYAEDTAVSDAKHLDVFSLLKTEFEGRRLLDWARIDDEDLKLAFSPDAAMANDWISAFKALVRDEVAVSTHPLAKQIYWLAGEAPHYDDQYHLLQPMFSSSLAHAVHEDIQDARFGEANKEARQAFRDRTSFASPYRDYRNLVVRKLGGTKPQNISQLNSERGGVNYLLPSLPPPAWEQRGAHLLRHDTALVEFLRFEDVRKQVRALADFLLNVQKQDGTKPIRDARDEYTQKLAEQFALFGATVRARHPAGWTRDEACHLPWCEQLWLDPERVELPNREDPEHPEWLEDDQAFKADYASGDWADQVAERFGNWLNARLRDAGLAVSLPERNHWARQAVLDVAWPIPLQRRAQGGEP